MKETENSATILDLLGKTKKIRVSLTMNDKNLPGLKFEGDNNSVEYQLSAPFTTTSQLPVQVMGFDLKIDESRKKSKRDFPFYVSGFDINFGLLNTHFKRK